MGKGIRQTVTALAAACAIALVGAASAQAQAPVEVLVFHGPPDATTDAGVAAVRAGGFEVDATADPAQISTANLANYRAVVFLNTAGEHLDDTQEAALEDYVTGGGGFVGIGSTAQGEPDSEFFTTLIGARPSGSSSTATSEQAVVAGDRVHPATRDLPLVWNRTDVWYQWNPRPTGKVHTVIRYRAPNSGAGDGISAHSPDQPISWCTDVSDGRSFYMGMGRTADAFAEERVRTHLKGAIQWSAGLIRGNCKAGIDANYRGHPDRAGRPDRQRARSSAASRTAWSPRPTAGCSTSAAATAGPTPSAASSSGSRRCRASSTTRTRTSGSAAARSTCGTRRPTTARSTAA